MTPRDPSTEQRNPVSKGLDTRPAIEIATLMHAEDSKALAAIKQALPAIAEAAEDAASTIRRGGRVLYAGSGTSGRLAVLDASEIRPTFGSSSFGAAIAGGERALTEAIEGAEDDREAGAEAAAGLSNKDMALGVSASGSTPYVQGFMEAAVKRGVQTWLLTCSPDAPVTETVKLITLLSGPELIAGSTRLKAGTATKMALNMLSTSALVLLGGTHDGLMVDVVPANKKLIQRAESIVMEIAGCAKKEAAAALKDSGMSAKTAALMLMRGISRQEAEEALKRAGGSLRKAIGSE